MGKILKISPSEMGYKQAGKVARFVCRIFPFPCSCADRPKLIVLSNLGWNVQKVLKRQILAFNYSAREQTRYFQTDGIPYFSFVASVVAVACVLAGPGFGHSNQCGGTGRQGWWWWPPFSAPFPVCHLNPCWPGHGVGRSPPPEIAPCPAHPFGQPAT